MIETIITSSVLILIIISLRYLLRGKISLRLQYALWVLVAFRLLIPFTLYTSHVSVMNVADFNQVENIVSLLHMQMNSLELVNSSAKEYAANTGIQIEEIQTSELYITPYQKAFKSMTNLFLPIWLYGTLLVVLCLVTANIRFSRSLKKRAVCIAVADCPLSVYRADGLPSPCLFGILHPAIY